MQRMDSAGVRPITVAVTVTGVLQVTTSTLTAHPATVTSMGLWVSHVTKCRDSAGVAVTMLESCVRNVEKIFTIIPYAKYVTVTLMVPKRSLATHWEVVAL